MASEQRFPSYHLASLRTVQEATRIKSAPPQNGAKSYVGFLSNLLSTRGDRGSTVVKVLCYKSEGRWFDPSWRQWIFH